MHKSNLKFPVGLAITLVIGLVGFRDTGIFVNNFNARLSSGVEVSYNANKRAEIVGEGDSKSTYLVEADGNRFYVPKETILKVDTGIEGYTVLKNTPLLNESGNVIRLLFKDEYLRFVLADNNNKVIVETSDNQVGYVDTKDLDPKRIRNITEGIAKKDLSLFNGTHTLKISQGDTVKVAWFEKDYFILFDEAQNKFNVQKDNISIYVDREKVVEDVLDLARRANVREEIAIEETYTANVSDKVSSIIDGAFARLGSPYVWGDTGSKGYDCSGLVTALYSGNTNVKLPRSSRDMAEVGTYVSASELIPGDLLFFNSGGDSTINHVAIYIGNGKMIHSSNSQRGVVLDPVDGYYFQNNFSHARRVLD